MIQDAPHPKQMLFHNAVARYDEVGFGGARGPGKTRSLCREAIRQSLDYPGNEGAIFRKNLTDLIKTTMREMEKLLPIVFPDGAGTVYRWKRSSPMMLEIQARPGVWSKIWWDDTKEPASYQSGNLGWAGIDEATQVSYEFVQAIRGTLGRCQLPDGTMAPGRLFWASNPGPGWCKQEFPVGGEPRLIRTQLTGRDGQIRDGVRAFVPALARDNPSLDPFFESNLRTNNPKIWCDRFLEGNWDAFEGQAFPEFDEELHTTERGIDLSGADYAHVLCMDWGYVNPAAAHLCSWDRKGHLWIWREHRGDHMTPLDHAPRIDYLKRGVTPTVWLFDYAATDQSTGVTVRQQFVDLGYPFMGCTKHKNGPDGSVMFFKALLQQDRVHIAPECVGLIQELKNARWQTPKEDREAKEQLEDKDDHSIDAVFMAVEWYRLRPAAPLTEQQQARREAQERFHLERTDAHNNVLRRRDEWGKPVGQRHRGLRI
jgi:hypothetical protein